LRARLLIYKTPFYQIEKASRAAKTFDFPKVYSAEAGSWPGPYTPISP
jgi:hypothetical protein